MSLKKQLGLAAVETATIGALIMITVFGVLEVSRGFYVYNALEEATRRGARMAAVCQPGDAAIARVAVFNDANGGNNSSLISGLTTGNVAVTYLNDAGAQVNPATNYGDISFVRVAINGYQHEMFIPFIGQVFPTPEFATTLPRESLGVTREGLQQC